ncbi:unnamed protein product, partial [Iphiclides podalirius]
MSGHCDRRCLAGPLGILSGHRIGPTAPIRRPADFPLTAICDSCQQTSECVRSGLWLGSRAQFRFTSAVLIPKDRTVD